MNRQSGLGILLPLALALSACGGGTPDDEAVPVPAPDVPAPAAGQAPQPPAATEPLPDPDAPLPQAAIDEHGAPQPWALAAQLGGGLQALSEGCGIEGEAGLDDMQPEARRQMEQLGTDMQAFDALWKQTHARARRDFAAGSAEQKAEACAELEQMRAMAEQFEAQHPQP